MPTPSAPPFEPPAFATLLLEQPARAAALLATMRPQQRRAQAQAHAVLTRFTPSTVEAAWTALIARHIPTPPDPDDTPALATVHDPETFAALLHDDPPRARALLARLSEPQRVAQATAHTAWLNSFAYPVSVDEILEWFSSLCAPDAS